MPTVRRSRIDVDDEALLAYVEAARAQTEAQIEQHAKDDGGAQSKEELAEMTPVRPHVNPRAAE